MPRSQHAKQLNNELTLVPALRDNHSPRKARRIKIKYGTLVCALLMLWVFFNLVSLHWTIAKLDKEIVSHLKQKQQLVTHQEQLKEDMEMVQSGDYIEKLAREQLGMVKPGENPVETRDISGDISN